MKIVWHQLQLRCESCSRTSPKQHDSERCCGRSISTYPVGKPDGEQLKKCFSKKHAIDAEYMYKTFEHAPKFQGSSPLLEGLKNLHDFFGEEGQLWVRVCKHLRLLSPYSHTLTLSRSSVKSPLFRNPLLRTNKQLTRRSLILSGTISGYATAVRYLYHDNTLPFLTFALLAAPFCGACFKDSDTTVNSSESWTTRHFGAEDVKFLFSPRLVTRAPQLEVAPFCPQNVSFGGGIPCTWIKSCISPLLVANVDHVTAKTS